MEPIGTKNGTFEVHLEPFGTKNAFARKLY